MLQRKADNLGRTCCSHAQRHLTKEASPDAVGGQAPGVSPVSWRATGSGHHTLPADTMWPRIVIQADGSRPREGGETGKGDSKYQAPPTEVSQGEHPAPT
jgi:hypothetical protein